MTLDRIIPSAASWETNSILWSQDMFLINDKFRQTLAEEEE